MDINAFKKSLLTDNCPSGISVHLQALWYDAKDNWNKAHELIQVVPFLINRCEFMAGGLNTNNFK